MVSSVCFGWAFGRGAGRECDVLVWESSSFGAVGVGVGGRQGGQRVRKIFADKGELRKFVARRSALKEMLKIVFKEEENDVRIKVLATQKNEQLW